MTTARLKGLRQRLPNLVTDEPLSRHTTMRVGGEAGAFIVVKTVDDLINAVIVARELAIPYHILGGGTNTLFSDRGFEGLVIKNMANQVEIAGQVDRLDESDWQQPVGEARHEAADPNVFVSFLDLNYDERAGDTLVIAESGVNLTALIIKTLDAGLTGLQWFGGIPGVVGGAVYNNIHGGTHFIGQRLAAVTALKSDNSQQRITANELDLGYDHSRFHNSDEVILTAEFLLTKGTAPEIERAEYTFREWIKRKSQMQPKLGSLGSTFQNISQVSRQAIKAPTTSAGWLIDQTGLCGYRLGQAQIAPEHANFIINRGGATASEVYQLIQLAKKKVKAKFGIDLREEIFLVGDF